MNSTDKQRIEELRFARARGRRNIAAAWQEIADPIDRARYIEVQAMALKGLDFELGRLGYCPPPVIRLDAPPPRQPSPSPIVKHINLGLTVRSFDNDQRVLQGLATTPETDLLGDRVNPLGSKYELPLPLLHHHKHDQPVGHVTHATAKNDGITITAKLARVDEPGPLKDRVDLAWQEIRSGLVSGLSIGFRAIEREVLPDGGYYFKSWQWLELSLVTVAAQPQARITATRAA